MRVPAFTLSVLAVLASTGYAQAPIDEVVVRATKDTVVLLAKEAQRAEHRFYDRYNQLNTVRDYKVSCATEAHTGSRFTWDDCQPMFEEKAHSVEGIAFIHMVQGFNETGSGGAASPGVAQAPASVMAAAGRPAFQKHMAELTRANPELTRLLNDYSEALKKYQGAFRSYHGRPTPEEKAPKAP